MKVIEERHAERAEVVVRVATLEGALEYLEQAGQKDPLIALQAIIPLHLADSLHVCRALDEYNFVGLSTMLRAEERRRLEELPRAVLSNLPNQGQVKNMARLALIAGELARLSAIMQGFDEAAN